MLLDRRSLPLRIAASACAGAAAFLTVAGASLIAKGSIGAALLVAAPLAAAQAASPSSQAQARLADEPAWGPSMGARVQARPAVADRTGVAAGSQTVAAETPAAERRSRN
ncbi:MAG: hypothetical protein LW835_14950 [Burkholderiaceae bacterium]|nr:hypothetical protein [Burkholderiaceae bacterium]